MLSQSILIRGNCIFSNFIFETVRMLGSKLVAGVLGKREGAHEQAEHEVEHGQKADGFGIQERLGQNTEHLAHVLDPFGVLATFVSSLSEVSVSDSVISFIIRFVIYAFFLLFEAEMSTSSSFKQFHFFDFFWLVLFIIRITIFIKRFIHSKLNIIGCTNIDDEWQNHCLRENEGHPKAVTLGVEEDEVLGLVHELEHQEDSALPVVHSFFTFGVGSELDGGYCCHGADPCRQAYGLELDPEVGLVVLGHCENEFFFIGTVQLEGGGVNEH